MLDAVSTLEGSHLTVVQRLQPNSFMRAHSTFRIRRDGGFRVDGSVFLPPAQSRSEIAALLAHELAHVLAVAGIVERDPSDPSDESLARSFEDAVRGELRSGTPTAFVGRSPFSRTPAELPAASLSVGRWAPDSPSPSDAFISRHRYCSKLGSIPDYGTFVSTAPAVCRRCIQHRRAAH
jgi:hypothetical protein